jgi:uncharacterized protein
VAVLGGSGYDGGIHSTPQPMFSEELDKLRILHEEGELTDEEYALAKDQLLRNSGSRAIEPREPGARQPLLGMTPSTYCIIMQLSQYAGYLVPLAGFAVPIAMWLIGRDDDPMVDQHGREIMNWIVSSLIYGFAGVAVCFTIIGLVIGIPALIILGVVSFILPIVGAINASNNERCSYPFNLRFFN